MISRLFSSLFILLVSASILADTLKLNPNHPEQYTVVKGDTLWDISGHFLEHPWQWPELWDVNSHIENPHLIYPGDQLVLNYRNGKPVLELIRNDSPTYKMSPEVQEIMLESAIPTIPFSEIEAFLTRPQVLSEEELASAPYVIASSDERIISGANDIIYVREISEEDAKNYSVFREGRIYRDFETQEILGYEALYKGNAWVVKTGDPATLELKSTTQEVLLGDRLLPVPDDDFEMNFVPRAPDDDIDGAIISVFNGVSQIGQFQIAVIDRGSRNNLEVGHILSILQRGKTVRDDVTKKRNDVVTLPDESAGVGMVFKTFEKVSYIIIMQATRAIHIHDKVRSID